MTKTEWQGVLEGLRKVPAKSRTVTWENAVSFVEGIISGKNNLAPEVDSDPESLRFSVRCGLCKRFIRIGDDYVYRGITGTYTHYDCNYRTDDAPPPPRV